MTSPVLSVGPRGICCTDDTEQNMCRHTPLTYHYRFFFHAWWKIARGGYHGGISCDTLGKYYLKWSCSGKALNKRSDNWLKFFSGPRAPSSERDDYLAATTADTPPPPSDWFLAGVEVMEGHGRSACPGILCCRIPGAVFPVGIWRE